MSDAYRRVPGGLRLDDIMSLDHVVEVHDDGTVTDGPAGIYAPTVTDERPDDCRWTLLNGYSGQYRYSGPIMHNSEFIGGRMADDILSTPGIYVAVAAQWSPDDDDDDYDTPDTVEGWAVARLEKSDHNWVSGMCYVDSEDVATVKAEGSVVECERCGVKA